MYTSCGWFFSDLSGIETTQVMKYAARIFDFMSDLGLPSPEKTFLEILAEAKSNITEYGSGADVYHRYAQSCRVTPEGVAAHLAISYLVNHPPAKDRVGGEIV